MLTTLSKIQSGDVKAMAMAMAMAWNQDVVQINAGFVLIWLPWQECPHIPLRPSSLLGLCILVLCTYPTL